MTPNDNKEDGSMNINEYNLTIEQIKEILGNAPDGATHFDVDGEGYIERNETSHFDHIKGKRQKAGYLEPHHNLSDLREILSLRQRVKELEDDHEKWLAEHRQLKPCYECGALVHELSPRSRCCMCEYNRAIFNEEENNQLRGQDYE